jgi:hypothetical protein
MVNVGGDTFWCRMMLKIAEKLDFQVGTTVEVCKNLSRRSFLRATICGSSNFSDKICKKKLQKCTIRGIF